MGRDRVPGGPGSNLHAYARSDRKSCSVIPATAPGTVLAPGTALATGGGGGGGGDGGGAGGGAGGGVASGRRSDGTSPSPARRPASPLETAASLRTLEGLGMLPLGNTAGEAIAEYLH